jgi:hypothetical protein
MYRLKKFDLGSVALYSFLIFTIISAIIFIPIGLFMSLLSNAIPEESFDESDINPLKALPGVLMILIPLIYGFFGALLNTLLAWIYNLLSVRFGGLRFQLEKVTESEAMNQTPAQ